MSQHSAGSHAGNVSSSLVHYHSPSSSQSAQLNGLQEGAVHRLRLLVKHGPHGARASPQRSRYYNIISPTLCSHTLFSMGRHSREGKTPLRSDSHLNHVLLKGQNQNVSETVYNLVHPVTAANMNSVHAETSFSNRFLESSLSIIFITELRNKNHHFKRKAGFYFFSNNLKKSCKSICRSILLFYL